MRPATGEPDSPHAERATLVGDVGGELDRALPAQVRTALDAGVSPVWVDADALPDREHIDANLLALLARYLNAARSQATVRAYASDWRTFTTWCRREDLSPLPAAPVTVATYLAAAASTLRPARTTHAGQEAPRWQYATSTLERHTAAIVAVHNAHGAPSPRAPLVRQTLAGIRKYRRTPTQRSRPVELGDLRKMLEARPGPGWPGGPARRRDRCLLLFGFAGALRRSEASALDLTDVGYHPDDGLHVTLRSSKTDQDGQGAVIALPFGSQPLTCPVCAYLSWVEVLEHHHAGGSRAVRQLLDRAGVDEPAAERRHLAHDQVAGWLTERTGPLFPPISRHGHLGAHAMSGDAIHDLVRRYAARAGLPATRISGHSLRAGFATTAARAGAPNRQIMRQGRWKSHATVDGYVRLSNPLDDNAVTKLGL